MREPCPRLWSPDETLEMEDVRTGRARREIGGEGEFRPSGWRGWRSCGGVLTLIDGRA